MAHPASRRRRGGAALNACPRRSCRGFGLLEAIVALAIFAGAGMVIFAWINANLERIGRLTAREAETRAFDLALEWAEGLDPAKTPTGRFTLDAGTEISWTSEMLTPRTAAQPLPGGKEAPFELALFELALTVKTPDLPAPQTFRLRRLGLWRAPLEWAVVTP